MSEDIDLVIDRTDLGCTGDRDPTATGLSGKERDRRIDALKQAAAAFVAGPLFDALMARFTTVLGSSESWALRVDASNLDNTLIHFAYPSTEPRSPYLRPEIQLELGARGDTWPVTDGSVTPYAAELFPAAFREPAARVRAIAAERTFWEKVTILHALAHQDAEKSRRAKPARHYYDVYRLWIHGLGQTAIRDHALLAEVVRHKTAFFRDPKARYELAVPGSLRIVPNDDVLAVIRPEYGTMAEEMIFGETPAFDTMLAVLRKVETAIND